MNGNILIHYFSIPLAILDHVRFIEITIVSTKQQKNDKKNRWKSYPWAFWYFLNRKSYAIVTTKNVATKNKEIDDFMFNIGNSWFKWLKLFSINDHNKKIVAFYIYNHMTLLFGTNRNFNENRYISNWGQHMCIQLLIRWFYDVYEDESFRALTWMLIKVCSRTTNWSLFRTIMSSRNA